MTASLNVVDILHPLDMTARQQLERVPLLQQAVRTYLGAVADRKLRQALLANALRLGPRQLPEIYRILPPICDAFGIAEPELYLTRGDANAYTIGHSHTAIVIQSDLLEDLSEDEVEAVLAHECGHILAEHILYRQMAQAMVHAGTSAAMMGSPVVKAVAAIGSAQLQAALFNWYRKSEFTADRAAVAYLGEAEPLQRALFHIIGVPKWMPGNLSHTAFLEQAEEFEDITESSKWEKFLSRGLDSGATHPMPVLRLREMTIWFQSERFMQIRAIAQAAKNGRETRRPCAQCGQALDPEWKFCQHCGNPVTSDDRALKE
jgi:Zn-dependent protease with chaperone function